MSNIPFPSSDLTVVRTATTIDIVVHKDPTNDYWLDVDALYGQLEEFPSRDNYQAEFFLVEATPDGMNTFYVCQFETRTIQVSYLLSLLAFLSDGQRTPGPSIPAIGPYIPPPLDGDPFNPSHTYVQRPPHRPGNKNVPHRRLPMFTTHYE